MAKGKWKSTKLSRLSDEDFAYLVYINVTMNGLLEDIGYAKSTPIVNKIKTRIAEQNLSTKHWDEFSRGGDTANRRDDDWYGWYSWVDDNDRLRTSWKEDDPERRVYHHFYKIFFAPYTRSGPTHLNITRI